ncbi:hypothetical protein F5J12DRAFT_829584 [Pisolithus orientalis]|uniref:uncharacterized protein n=1 Tax=Pisolithus orientalis TaxID=936130 RepID=UPI002224C1CE|nr:uncharacterized protein F5J12DRAFT_829584 [Pisolithus orientalis]KAI6007648.1 hypothetical protein F5J12DRAFT_829584 [Pisolithus orientalis]
MKCKGVLICVLALLAAGTKARLRPNVLRAHEPCTLVKYEVCPCSTFLLDVLNGSTADLPSIGYISVVTESFVTTSGDFFPVSFEYRSLEATVRPHECITDDLTAWRNQPNGMSAIATRYVQRQEHRPDNLICDGAHFSIDLDWRIYGAVGGNELRHIASFSNASK